MDDSGCKEAGSATWPTRTFLVQVKIPDALSYLKLFGILSEVCQQNNSTWSVVERSTKRGPALPARSVPLGFCVILNCSGSRNSLDYFYYFTINKNKFKTRKKFYLKLRNCFFNFISSIRSKITFRANINSSKKQFL